MKFTISRVDISVKLKNGIYVLPHESAIGKTYLRKLLMDGFMCGLPTISYSLEDYARGFDITPFLDNPNFKLVMLDRYDHYMGAFADAMNRNASNKVILLDAKTTVPDSIDWNFCSFIRNEGSIEVL